MASRPTVARFLIAGIIVAHRDRNMHHPIVTDTDRKPAGLVGPGFTDADAAGRAESPSKRQTTHIQIPVVKQPYPFGVGVTFQTRNEALERPRLERIRIGETAPVGIDSR